MRRWWGTLGRTEQVAAVGIAVSLIVGIVAVAPNYAELVKNRSQQLRAARGMPLLDPADPKTKERYGL
jgi:hypothetical protein